MAGKIGKGKGQGFLFSMSWPLYLKENHHKDSGGSYAHGFNCDQVAKEIKVGKIQGDGLLFFLIGSRGSDIALKVVSKNMNRS